MSSSAKFLFLSRFCLPKSFSENIITGSLTSFVTLRHSSAGNFRASYKFATIPHSISKLDYFVIHFSTCCPKKVQTNVNVISSSF